MQFLSKKVKNLPQSYFKRDKFVYTFEGSWGSALKCFYVLYSI